MSPSPRAEPVVVTPGELRSRPLPDHGPGTSKYDRGCVLVVGGSAGTPGAVLLAGVAALRAGAGKLQLATAATAAPALAVTVPEARVVALPETAGGVVTAAGAGDLIGLLGGCDAVLAGTGTLDPDETGSLLRALLPALGGALLVADAGALPVLADEPDLLAGRGDRAVMMPNPAEMASLLGRSVDAVTGDPATALADAVARFGVVVTLRGPETWTAAPGTPLFVDRAGSAGLATSGSGDVLAGILAGLGARGADGLTAALWATSVHAAAGDRCAARGGGIGYLARDLLDEIPAALGALCR